MSVTWPYAQFVKAAKAAGGPAPFCRDLMNQGYQKGCVAMGKKCVPVLIATGTFTYLWGKMQASRQKNQESVQVLREWMHDLIKENQRTRIRERIHEMEDGGDEVSRESESVASVSSSVRRHRVMQYGPVDYRRQLRIVGDHWFMANMDLGEREYDSANVTRRRVLEDAAAASIRTGMEIAVDCILRLRDVPDVGDMDLCQKISACGRYLEPALIERMHMARKLCNRCLHGSDRPVNTKEQLVYAAKTLGTLKSYLETYLAQPPTDEEEL